MILVGGLDYWTIKQKALNGHRAKLSVEQLTFVGFEPDTTQLDQQGNHGSLVGKPQPNHHGGLVGWLQPVNPSNIDKQLEELARMRDIAPGWLELARRILENEKSKS